MGTHQLPSARVLVVDDDESMCELLGAELAPAASSPSLENDPERALETLRTTRGVDVVVTDLRMMGISGVELCERIARRTRSCRWCCSPRTARWTRRSPRFASARSTSSPSHPTSTRWWPPSIAPRATGASQKRCARSASRATAAPEDFEGLIGASPPMRELVQLVGRVAAVEAAVLVHGESGTGKELVARALHERSHRRAHSFVALNCAAIPETMLEAELFGHVKGAFTDARTDRPGLFEKARGGTIFLDEIAELHIVAAAQAAARAAGAAHPARRLGHGRSRSTSGSSRRPTPTCRRPSRSASSAQTCSTA